jgi:hypothetical protein
VHSEEKMIRLESALSEGQGLKSTLKKKEIGFAKKNIIFLKDLLKWLGCTTQPPS